jgi:hypothetical protein
MFRVDPKTVTRWARQGKLTAGRTPGGRRLYSEREVADLLRRQTCHPAPGQPVRPVLPVKAGPTAETLAEVAALNADYPGWHVWLSDAGMVYATCNRPSAVDPGQAGLTEHADAPWRMRAVLAGFETADREKARRSSADAMLAAWSA